MAPNVIEMVTGTVDGDLNQFMDDLLSNKSAPKSVLVCHTNELVVRSRVDIDKLSPCVRAARYAIHLHAHNG